MTTFKHKTTIRTTSPTLANVSRGEKGQTNAGNGSCMQTNVNTAERQLT